MNAAILLALVFSPIWVQLVINGVNALRRKV